MVSISLIVAVYKDVEATELILGALEKQNFQDFEIIVAEDCQSDEMATCIQKYNHLNLKHTSQIDNGWQKNASLNKAIRIATGELLVFIDGDCIPNRNFVEEYDKHKKECTVLCGRRIELGPKYSTRLRNAELNIESIQKNYLFNSISLLMDGVRHYEEGIYFNDLLFDLKHKGKKAGILGCNFAVNRKDIEAINGFNEEYKSPSVGEDTDIEYRLRLKGCQLERIRNKSFVFHLYHKEVYDEKAFNRSMKVFTAFKKQNTFVCSKGLKKLSNDL